MISLIASVGLKLLSFAQKRASENTERLRIKAGVDIEEIKRDVAVSGYAAQTVQKAMEFKVFWIPWLMAAVPTELWFGWGMLDSLANGALPDVAALPPQLKEYADVVHSNIFYTGAAGLLGTGLHSAVKSWGRRQ